MFDKVTLTLLHILIKKCSYMNFYREYRDLCLAARLATSNVRGNAVRLRPSLLRLEDLSDSKAASHLLNKIKREVGPVADAVSLKHAAVAYIYRKLATLA